MFEYFCDICGEKFEASTDVHIKCPEYDESIHAIACLECGTALLSIFPAEK